MLWRKIAPVPVKALVPDTPVAVRAKELLGDILAVAVAGARPQVWRALDSGFAEAEQLDQRALQLLWNSGLAQRAGAHFGRYDSKITPQGAVVFGLLRI
jgi:hypothetical protein